MAYVISQMELRQSEDVRLAAIFSGYKVIVFLSVMGLTVNEKDGDKMMICSVRWWIM